MRQLHFLPFLASIAAAALGTAQNPLHGNGVPSAYIENTPGMLGGNLVVGFGSPTTPGSVAVVAISGSFTPFVYPFAELGGPVAIDPLDPGFNFFLFGLDGAGNGTVSLALPPGFLLPISAPLFADTITFESPTQWSVSKTTRIDWMVGDTWEFVPPLASARQLHTATALGSDTRDNVTEVLIAGGATGSFILPLPMASAELFSPLTRTVSPLPSLALPRSLHRAVRLQDGRVLITGGATTGGVVTATCEFYLPQTQQFVPAPSMAAARSGHAMTLLNDGRVLVTGGVADWQNAAVNFIAVLNTAQDTAEIFDPVANTWSPLPNMAAKRVGHMQTLLQDGRVLVVGGIRGAYAGAQGGGQIPIYTTSCQVFDPATGTFAATAPLTRTIVIPPFNTTQVWSGRAFHGQSLLPNGDVLVTGGFVAQPATAAANDETVNSGFTDVWSVSTGTWTIGTNLPQSMSFHGQLPLGNGALVCGGFSGLLSTLTTTAAMCLHDGVTVTPLAPILGGGRGGHSLTRLCDGTFLVYGGGVWPNTVADGWIYAPN